MTSTQSAQVSYRKTKTGEWVVCGPAWAVTPGPVNVTKKDGSTKTETVERVGKPFARGQSMMVYGYLAKTGGTSNRASGTRRPSRNHRRQCDECGDWATPGTVCWETGFQH